MSNQTTSRAPRAPKPTAEEIEQFEADAKDLWMAAHNEHPKLNERNMHWTVRDGVIGIRVNGSLTVKGVQFYGFPKSESYTTMRVRLMRAVATCFDFSA